ncbi:MAG: sulfatase [Planctomycetota bacterium]
MPQRPNIVFITSHDIGRHLGCYGVQCVSSPGIDAIATTGVRCADACCASPICSPARASMATGRFPHAHGVTGLIHLGWELNEGETHLASRLERAGYDTALAGLQHETGRPEQHGLAQSLTGGRADAHDIAEACERFFGEPRQRPFYLQVGFFEPHRYQGTGFGPATPDDPDRVEVFPWLQDTAEAREEVAQFQGAIRLLDQAVTRIDAALRDRGFAEDTLVIFASDHGVPFPRAKASCYEAGIHIALIARWPNGGIDGHRVCDLPINGVDLVPTILDLIGEESSNGVHGRSVAEAWRGGAMPATPIFSEMNFHAYFDPMRAVRDGTTKLIVNFAPGAAFYDTSQQWRPRTQPAFPADPRNAKHPLVELYDLQSDPWEQHNLAEEPAWQDARQQQLKNLSDWMHGTEDFLLTTPPLDGRGRAALDLVQQT